MASPSSRVSDTPRGQELQWGVLSVGGEPVTVVRLVEIENWADGHDPRGINFGHARIVSTLDMFKVGDLGDAGMLVEFQGVIPQIRIFVDVFFVALEMGVINHIEAQHC